MKRIVFRPTGAGPKRSTRKPLTGNVCLAREERLNAKLARASKVEVMWQGMSVWIYQTDVEDALQRGARLA